MSDLNSRKRTNQQATTIVEEDDSKKKISSSSRLVVRLRVVGVVLILSGITLLLASAASYYHSDGKQLDFGFYKWLVTPSPRYFTMEELRKYDGTNPDLPIYLSFMGDVYDVTSGVGYYGPKGGYHCFAGTDATRAFMTGCFRTGATHDLRGFSEEQMKSFESWGKFYSDHETYRFVGKAILPWIDPKSPLPIDNCQEAEAALKKQEDEARLAQTVGNNPTATAN